MEQSQPWTVIAEVVTSLHRARVEKEHQAAIQNKYKKRHREEEDFEQSLEFKKRKH